MAREDDPDWALIDMLDAECLDDEDDCEADCGLMPNGQCMLAGTEFCDWECGRLG
jgi:hypothetical protein